MKPNCIEEVEYPVIGEEMPQEICPTCGSRQVVGAHSGGEYMDMECLECGTVWEQRLEGVV